MNETYTLHVAGLERELPICPVNDKLSIAAFVLFSDVELTVACARDLLQVVPDFDAVLTAEAKGIPLAYEMARQSGKPYYLARKGIKVYMPDVVEADVQSITTAGLQKLYLERAYADAMAGKRILIVDDVISTGQSLAALEHLVGLCGGVTAAKAAVLAEGDATERADIVYLEKLPLFFRD